MQKPLPWHTRLRDAMSKLPRKIFEQLSAASRESLVVVEMDAQTILYVNPAFEKLSGYRQDEVRGRHWRLLQNHDCDQEGVALLHAAMERRETAEVLLRNYRKDGSLFWNLLKITPLKTGSRTRGYYAAFLKDVTGEIRARRVVGGYGAQNLISGEAQPQSKHDKLTGLYARPYFGEMSQRDWSMARRDGKTVSALIASIDFFAQYQETFGPQAAESCLRLVAHAIAGSLRRASDPCGRYSEREFAAVLSGMEAEEAIRFAETIRKRVAELCVHHPRSDISKYVTVSIGVSTHTPSGENTLRELIATAQGALSRAKECGRDRVAGGDIGSHRKTA